MNKIETYFGFAKKAGKIVYGLDNIAVYSKKSYLMIICSTASENLKKQAVKSATRLNVLLYETVEKLDVLIKTDNCKLILVKDNSLSKAILEKNIELKLLKEVTY